VAQKTGLLHLTAHMFKTPAPICTICWQTSNLFSIFCPEHVCQLHFHQLRQTRNSYALYRMALFPVAQNGDRQQLNSLSKIKENTKRFPKVLCCKWRSPSGNNHGKWLQWLH